jgi:tRNA nucleotidyltransferase (CCA-adding enzyme)
MSLVSSPTELGAASRALAEGPRLAPIVLALGSDADVHLVGGAVRDLALGAAASDIDIASRLLPEEAALRCVRSGLKVVETGLKHGTITIVHEGEHIELTTFRQPNPHHVNKYALSITEDLGGRDFTINALAVSLSSYALVDPFLGLSDLASRTLRCVGDASQRFNEDPLRLLRMIRFGVAAGRTVTPQTLEAAQRHAERILEVSPERVQVELKRILVTAHPAAAIRQMLALGLLKLVLPELIPMVGVEQNEFHTEDVFDHTLSVLERCPPNAMLRLIALFHDSGKPATLSVGEDGRRHFYEHETVSERLCLAALERLKFSGEEITHVSRVVRMHMRPIECGPPGIRRILRDVAPYYDDWRTFKYADAPPIMADDMVLQRLSQFDEMVAAELRRREKQGNRLAVRGDDLIALGMKPGAAMGKLLKELEELVIENPDRNTKEELLREAQKRL